MKLILILKNEKEYVFKGVREYSIEYGKYLKITYTGENDNYWSKNAEKVHEGLFMLDAIAGYYINRW